jgi:hypothetical protein
MTDDYRQSTVAGTSYQRGRSLYFENPKGSNPSLLIREERITVLADREIAEPAGEILRTITPEMMATTFQLRNPTDNEPIPNGTFTYQDLYVVLFSLYWHLAEERDAESEI